MHVNNGGIKGVRHFSVWGFSKTTPEAGNRRGGIEDLIRLRTLVRCFGGRYAD
jgi:hypothetical protein